MGSVEEQWRRVDGYTSIRSRHVDTQSTDVDALAIHSRWDLASPDSSPSVPTRARLVSCPAPLSRTDPLREWLDDPSASSSVLLHTPLIPRAHGGSSA